VDGETNEKNHGADRNRRPGCQMREPGGAVSFMADDAADGGGALWEHML